MGPADYTGVVKHMHLASGLAWSLPITLAAEATRRADEIALTDEAGRLDAILEVEQVYEYDKRTRGRLVYRTDDDAHPGVAAVYAQARHAARRRRSGSSSAQHAAFPQHRRDPRADARRLRRARLAPRRRVPDAQPDAPRARVHHEVRARDRRRAAAAPAGRRDQAGDDIPRRRAHALLRGAARALLPAPSASCSASSRRRCATPGRARRSSTPSCARTTAARTSSSGATTPASAATTAPTTRSDLRRVRAAASSASSRSGSSTRSGVAASRAWRPRRRRPYGPDERVILSGTRVREMLARGELPPAEFSRPEIADVLIEWARGR